MANSRLNRQLGDTFLDEKESVAREREALMKLRETHKPHGQEEMTAERSKGSAMHYSELLVKLRRLCPRLTVRDGIEGNVALYRPKTESEMMTDGYDLAVPQWYNEEKYVTGLPKAGIPEWGHFVNDTDGVAAREHRGWRSVLMTFIKTGICTYKQAVAEFGDPAEDQRSTFWFEQMQEYKTGKKENRNV
jgi:hypothetical protein